MLILSKIDGFWKDLVIKSIHANINVCILNISFNNFFQPNWPS